ncbi:MAG TPA: hypothetical protein DEP84_13130 [Chloroflexi bacterium]|nr:hypothetical protein [Chloroflexota bacterium]
MNITAFLEAVIAWAEDRCDVVGRALVGSYARGVARPDSDIDLVILSESPADLLDGSWPARFGDVQSSSIEDYGASKSRRIFYCNGLEVEFGIAAPNWASIPLDAGTKRVLTDGVKVLYDPKQLLRAANQAARA